MPLIKFFCRNVARCMHFTFAAYLLMSLSSSAFTALLISLYSNASAQFHLFSLYLFPQQKQHVVLSGSSSPPHFCTEHKRSQLFLHFLYLLSYVIFILHWHFYYRIVYKAMGHNSHEWVYPRGQSPYSSSPRLDLCLADRGSQGRTSAQSRRRGLLVSVVYVHYYPTKISKGLSPDAHDTYHFSWATLTSPPICIGHWKFTLQQLTSTN